MIVDISKFFELDYYRVELLSHGPLSIWLHHLRKKEPKFRSAIEITSSALPGWCMTLNVKTELTLDSNLPIYIPDSIDVIIKNPNVTVVTPIYVRIKGKHRESAVPMEDFDSVIIVNCAEVKKYKDTLEFHPSPGAIVFVEGGLGHKVFSETESTRLCFFGSPFSWHLTNFYDDEDSTNSVKTARAVSNGSADTPAEE